MMSENKSDIILSNNKSLSSYSSKIIQKGLILANKLALSKSEFFISDMSAEEYYKAGMSKKDEENYHEALENFNQAIILDNTLDCAYIERGDIYRRLGEIEKAIEDYTQAINIGSADYYSYLGRGDLFSIIGEFQKAIFDYNLAIETDEYGLKDEEIYIKRGCAWEHPNYAMSNNT